MAILWGYGLSAISFPSFWFRAHLQRWLPMRFVSWCSHPCLHSWAGLMSDVRQQNVTKWSCVSSCHCCAFVILQASCRKMSCPAEATWRDHVERWVEREKGPAGHLPTWVRFSCLLYQGIRHMSKPAGTLQPNPVPRWLAATPADITGRKATTHSWAPSSHRVTRNN